jgi:hypothetical protein
MSSKKENTKETMRVGVKNKSALPSMKKGEQVNLWGNMFTIGANGELEAELPVHIVEEGIAADRYILI